MSNSKIPHVNLNDTINTHRLRFNQLVDSVGDVSVLTTTAGSIVEAINEIDSDIGPNPHLNLTTTSKTLTEAINEINADIGNITAAGRALIDDASAAAQLITLGITATATELNVLDGVILTTTELNRLDGITGNVQSLLNLKAPLLGPTFTSANFSGGLSINGISWTISVSGAADSNLVFAWGGIPVMKLTKEGNLTVVGSVTPSGTI